MNTTDARGNFRVFVTGGAGFLGTHVLTVLAARSDVGHLVAADIVEPEHRVEGVIYQDHDVTVANVLPPLLERHRINVVVHLAGIINPGRDPTQDYQVDVRDTQNVLDACLATGIRRIVVSSSGAAYGYYADNRRCSLNPTRSAGMTPSRTHGTSA